MTIHDLSLKFKTLSKNTDILLSILIVAISLSSFALGRSSVSSDIVQTTNIQQKAASVQSGGLKTPENTDIPAKELTATPVSPVQSEGGYVASKNGTKYHLPWCGGAKQIKEENKVFFESKEEAESAGYTPASNCKGI